MTRINSIFFIFLCLVACTEDGFQINQSENTSQATVSFSASFDESPVTKTFYDASNRLPLWNREDMAGMIASYGAGSFTDAEMHPFSIQESNDPSPFTEFIPAVTFSGKLTEKGSQTYTYYAVYPYTAFMTVTDVSAFALRLEERQYPDLKSWDGACDILVSKPVTVNSYSVAASNLKLMFRRLFGVFRLKFGTSILDAYGTETVETISIESSAEGDKLAGKFTIDLASTEAPDPVMSTAAGDCFNKVTLDYRGKDALLSDIDAYFILNSGTYENVVVTIRTNAHTLTLPRTNLVISSGTLVYATLNWKIGVDDASDTTPILPRNPETLKILTFGHSFVEDSMEYMDELLNEAGITNVTIANFYQGNCSLQEYWGHVNNAGNTKGGSDKIRYFKRFYDGNTVTTLDIKKTVIEALCDEAWDVVVFQTALQYEGIYSQIGPALSVMTDYVKTTCETENGKSPLFAWHMFWAFGSQYTSPWFDTYHRNQELHYRANVQAAKEVMRNHDIQLIIPTGTAIQSLRQSSINNYYEFTRDWHHLDIGTGRYAAACTWFEFFMKPCFGISVEGLTWKPSKYSYMPVTDENRKILQRAAVLGCRSPFEISHLDSIDALYVTGGTETLIGITTDGSNEDFELIDNLTW